jgi:hypothetical protein
MLLKSVESIPVVQKQLDQDNVVEPRVSVLNLIHEGPVVSGIQMKSWAGEVLLCFFKA